MTPRQEHELQRARFLTRFPRGVAMLRAQAVANVFRSAATELEELAGAAHAYEPGTLFRKIRGVVVATIQAAVEAEGGES